ncbi:MAG: phosphoenolpyruvate--protein phosphotransferase [Caldithrix sp. RBG_13_44_9]|nr:MAG: phosphoenolpyruvate--protein phosphotransferase [Caldithrix sp. RBG_13_44_9]
MTENKRSDIIVKGIPASAGISIGPVFLYYQHTLEPELQPITGESVEAEIQKFQKAIEESREYLYKIHQETDQRYGRDFAEIVQVQISILDDTIFLNEVEQLIRKQLYNAEYATFKVFQHKKEHFLRLQDEYFRERALDIQNLKRLILKNLLGKKAEIDLKIKSIVVSDNINPAEIIKLHHQDILGFCTDVGGKNSHTAIVARSLGVPAVVGTEYITNIVQEEDYLILDGNEGIIIINPTPDKIKEYTEKQKKLIIFEKHVFKNAEKPALTRDGRRIQVMGNVEFLEELELLKKSGAEGIGLYRTEGIFLSGSEIPQEDVQTACYLRFAEALKPQEVIIRTLDIGGDKILPELSATPEGNPFLGWRAIRFCLDHKEIFIPQIKAILRANKYHNIKLLLPMISSLEEIRQFKVVFQSAQEILKSEEKEFNPRMDIGIMVEIPSAALMIESYIDEVDFFSIGTNDLVQYTLAVDRANEKISHLYNHFHPALLKLIRKVIEAGRHHKKMVSMCGEMAADPVAVPLLIGMGLENLSAAHYVVPEIKNVIRNIALSDCIRLYEKVRGLSTASEVQQQCQQFYSEIFTYPNHLILDN